MIDVETDTPMLEIKRQLALKTGAPGAASQPNCDQRAAPPCRTQCWPRPPCPNLATTRAGVPLEHIKVMLSGINQLVMGDKR